jgi:hypothetical protein
VKAWTVYHMDWDRAKYQETYYLKEETAERELDMSMADSSDPDGWYIEEIEVVEE